MERQTISRFIRQNIAGLLVGVTLGAITTGAITAASVSTSGNVSVGGTLTVTSTGTFLSSIISTNGLVSNTGLVSAGALQQYPGSSTSSAINVPSVLSSSWVNAAPGTTGEEVLKTWSLYANTLASSGRYKVTAWGIAAANANSKIVRLRLNGAGTTIAGACTFANAGDTTWSATWYVWRTAANTQATYVVCDGAATDAQATSTGAITDTATMTPVITVQNATAAADLTVKGADLEIYD